MDTDRVANAVGFVLVLIALMAATMACYATPVRIPALPGMKAYVRLVYEDAQSTQVIGFSGTEWATAYDDLDLATAQTVELTPTASIGTVDGKATCYRVALASTDKRDPRNSVVCVQVPDLVETQELSALVGAELIPPADIYAEIDPIAGPALATHAADTDLHYPGPIVWDDVRAPATTIPLQGQSGDADRDTDGSLLFDADSAEQVAALYQMPHAWVAGSAIEPHVHWAKTTDAAGDVIWELRYRVLILGQPAPAWSAWEGYASRSAVPGPDQNMIIDEFQPIDMTGAPLSSMVSIEIHRSAADVSDTYAADARMWEADIHYQRHGNGSASEFSP